MRDALMRKHHDQIAIDRQAIALMQDGKWLCLHSETREQTLKRLQASIAERIDILAELQAA
jgi:hypothetical protein